MAVSNPVKIQCSNCYAEFHSEIYTFIDRARDRDIVSSIFRGEFNYKHCPQCDNEGLVRYPVEVIDSEKGEKAIFIYLQDNKCPWRYEELGDSEAYIPVKVTMKGFSVREIMNNNRKESVIYDAGDLIETLISWGEEVGIFPDAPAEEDLEKAIESGVITMEETEIVRKVDFQKILEKTILQDAGEEDPSQYLPEAEFTQDEEEAFEIALRIQDWRGKNPYSRGKSRNDLHEEN